MSTVSEPIAAAPATKLPIPPVGWMVWWWGHGNLQARPIPAMVTATTPHGTIDLLTTRTDGYHKTVRGSWYVKDPAFQRVDHMMKGERGCWDFMPGTYYDMNHPETTPLAILSARVAVLEERFTAAEKEREGLEPGVDLETRVLALADKGLNAVQIAEKVQTTHQRVSGIIRTRPKQEE
jgi:hypothetical protein